MQPILTVREILQLKTKRCFTDIIHYLLMLNRVYVLAINLFSGTDCTAGASFVVPVQNHVHTPKYGVKKTDMGIRGKSLWLE